jgi:hypothetical protein
MAGPTSIVFFIEGGRPGNLFFGGKVFRSDHQSRLALLAYIDQQIAEGESLLLKPLNMDDLRRVVDQVAKFRRIRGRICEQLAGECQDSIPRPNSPNENPAATTNPSNCLCSVWPDLQMRDAVSR